MDLEGSRSEHTCLLTLNLAGQLVGQKSHPELARSLVRLLRQRDCPELADFIKRVDGLVQSGAPDFSEAFHNGQILSKLWMVDILKAVLPKQRQYTFALMGGWIGLLSTLLFWQVNEQVAGAYTFDKDARWAPIADEIHKYYMQSEWRFKASTVDIRELSSINMHCKTRRSSGKQVNLFIDPDVIINTSCEHIEGFSSWYRNLLPTQLLALQSNDFFSGDGHVNCCASLEEFAAQTPMREVLFEGELQLPEYTRFMRIGLK